MFFKSLVRSSNFFIRVGAILTMMGMALGVMPASASTPVIQVINDSQLQAMSTTIGGADVLPTTRTVAH
jgi:hypothetical protein